DALPIYLFNEKLRAVIILDRRDELAHQYQYRVFVGVYFFILLKGKLNAGINEKAAEDIDNPMEAFQEGYTDKNKEKAHDQCPKNAPEKHLVLIFRGYLEVGEDQQKNKDIIYAERFFNQITRVVVHGSMRIHEAMAADAEHKGLRHPDAGPYQPSFAALFMPLLVEDRQDDDQHGDNKDVVARREEKRVSRRRWVG